MKEAGANKLRRNVEIVEVHRIKKYAPGGGVCGGGCEGGVE